MTNELATQNEAQIMEGVLLGGDLSKLNPAQRVIYYQRVCESIGLNPLTKPFAYIQLNGKLTLYALKDAADQLRKINGVSIDDVDIVETETQFLVKVKGHDKTGRADVEIGVVSKKDMQGKAENVQMKAVTKAKRRLTLSICGLGMLDETEVQTVPDARPIVVTEEGEIDKDAGSAWNIENQETGEAVAVREIIDPMGEWAINYAADAWNISKSEAAKQIGAKKLGGKFDKLEFIELVVGAPKAA